MNTSKITNKKPVPTKIKRFNKNFYIIYLALSRDLLFPFDPNNLPKEKFKYTETQLNEN